MEKTEKGNMHDLSLMAMGTMDDDDNVNKINEHGSLGWSRMIIYKNIEEQLIGGCSASTMI